MVTDIEAEATEIVKRAWKNNRRLLMETSWWYATGHRGSPCAHFRPRVPEVGDWGHLFYRCEFLTKGRGTSEMECSRYGPKTIWCPKYKPFQFRGLKDAWCRLRAGRYIHIVAYFFSDDLAVTACGRRADTKRETKFFSESQESVTLCSSCAGSISGALSARELAPCVFCGRKRERREYLFLWWGAEVFICFRCAQRLLEELPRKIRWHPARKALEAPRSPSDIMEAENAFLSSLQQAQKGPPEERE